MDLSRYFDHAATTPVAPEVIDAMAPYWRDVPGNANSIHQFGKLARDAVEEARYWIAEAIGAKDPYQVVFTSGATESNNWVWNKSVDMLVSPIEHSSLLVPAGPSQLEIKDWTVGVNDLEVAVMAVNNETGGMPTMRGTPYLLHVDATQAIGKVPWSVGDASWVSLSAHKIGGPKGVGALYIRDGVINPMILGGGQESGLRAGTLNVSGIVGFGCAIRRAVARQEAAYAHATRLREIVLERLVGVQGMRVNDAPRQSPHILSLSFLGLLGETLVIELDHAGYAISSGAACSAGEDEEESPVLRALGVPPEWNRGTIRISFGETNTEASAAGLARALAAAVENVRGLGQKS